MSMPADQIASELSAVLRDQRFVMVRAPASGYAGFVGAHAIVTDVANGSVYVLFESGMRDCYPPRQFLDLFRRQAWRRSRRASY